MNDAMDTINKVIEVIDDDEAKGIAAVIDKFGDATVSATAIEYKDMVYLMAAMIHEFSYQSNIPYKKILNEISRLARAMDRHKDMIEHRKRGEAKQ